MSHLTAITPRVSEKRAIYIASRCTHTHSYIHYACPRTASAQIAHNTTAQITGTALARLDVLSAEGTVLAHAKFTYSADPSEAAQNVATLQMF